MMACINVGALLEYGKPTGVLKTTGAVGSSDRAANGVPNGIKVRVVKKAAAPEDNGKMDVDGEGAEEWGWRAGERRRQVSRYVADIVGPRCVARTPAYVQAGPSAHVCDARAHAGHSTRTLGPTTSRPPVRISPLSSRSSPRWRTMPMHYHFSNALCRGPSSRRFSRAHRSSPLSSATIEVLDKQNNILSVSVGK